MGTSDAQGGCHGCRHFRVTYDPDWPYACEAFGLRAKRLPSIEVLEASGAPCRARESRTPPPSRPSRPGGTYA
jgi:hypothetical protein